MQVTGSMLERALRRDRAVVVAGLLLVVILSWGYLLSGAGMMDAMGGMLTPMTSSWSLGYAALIFSMWAVMMAAMMLPSAAPVILFYSAVVRHRSPTTRAPGSAGLFSLGYVAAWAVFSLAATALQFALEKATLMSSVVQTTSFLFAAAVLIGAGVYQFTPVKQACLRRCVSPLDVMLHWRPGARGAFTMGLRQGVFCVGCCWLLMLLLFIGGVMNLAWIAVLAVYVLVEKTLPAGHWISRAAGVLLVVWGVATLIALL